MKILFVSDCLDGSNPLAIYNHMKANKEYARYDLHAISSQNNIEYGQYNIGITNNGRCLRQIKAEPCLKCLTINTHHGNFFLGDTEPEQGIDASLVASQSEKEMLIRNGYNPKDVYITGAPRLDRLCNSDIDIMRNNYLTSINLDPNKKTVLYAPTYDRNNFGFGNKAFFARWQNSAKEIDVMAKLLRTLKEMDCNLIIRVHKYYKRYYKHLVPDALIPLLKNNAHITSNETDPDSIPVLASTDLLITDFSSIVADFITLDRPIIFIEPHENWIYTNRWHVPKEYRYEFGIVVKDDLETYVSNELAYPDKLSQQRKKCAAKYAPLADGKSSERAAQYILERYNG